MKSRWWLKHLIGGAVSIGVLCLSPLSAVASSCDGSQNGTSCSQDQEVAAAVNHQAAILAETARVSRRSGDFAAAAVAIEQALELAPERADTWIELGYLRRAQDDHDEALEAHTRAWNIDRSYVRAVLARLDSLANAGLASECVAAAPSALELAPDNAHTYAYRGRCLSDLGRTEEALDDYQKAIELGLEEAFLYSNIALAHLTLGRNENARDVAKRAVELDAMNEWGQLALVDALMALNAKDEAIEAFRLSLEAGVPDSIGRANALAWSLYTGGDYVSAEHVMSNYFEGNRQLGAEQAYEADTFAHILAARGKADEAVEKFLLAVELGGAAKAEEYAAALAAMNIEVGDGPKELEAALQTCAARGSACRMAD